MELKATKYLDDQEFQAFFDETMPGVEQVQHKEHGYFLYDHDLPIAFFTLIEMEDQVCWLRSLLIKRQAHILLPVSLIQSAEQLAANRQASHLVTHSTSQILDELFTQLGYKPSNQALDQSIEANWWITSLENVDKTSSYTQS
ncbi:MULTISPECIES: hypothetical protein [Gracilibacillus]|uniref:hypothetical protein n=1 Tax=Gracilibacillus TaxID=74385 RepID=UPI000823FB69|nr:MULTISPECIES: hypothetical protein [Gracilibacillus]